VTSKEYTEQFQQQEAKCQEEIRNAREVLEKAKQDFEQKKPRPEKEEAHFISDDEDAKDKVAKESTQRILSGLQHMTNNLTELSAQAEFECQEAQRRKRPRKTSKGDEATPAEDGAHFGAPGQ
jgi:predicted  nucleic acid-binding Zn-ribbon protein